MNLIVHYFIPLLCSSAYGTARLPNLTLALDFLNQCQIFPLANFLSFDSPKRNAGRAPTLPIPTCSCLRSQST